MLEVRGALERRRGGPDARGVRRGARRRGHRPGPDRSGLARHRLRRTAHRQVRTAPRDRAAPALHPRHQSRELLRERLRGVSWRRLRRGVRGLRHRARAWSGKAEGHRLRRPPAAYPRRRERPVLGELLRPRRVRAARVGVPGTPRTAGRGSEARDGPRFRQEPRQRLAESEGPSAQPDRRGSRAERADDRGAARAVRLLRRVGRCGVRNRGHPRSRTLAGKDGPCHGQGAPALGLERDRGAAQLVGRKLLHDHPQGIGTRLQGGGDRQSARGAEPRRGPRLLLDHRADHDGGPAHLARGRRGEGT